jgi:hypothetical protein
LLTFRRGLRTAHATFVTATQEFIDSLPDGAKSRFQRVDNPEAMVISIQDYIKLLESQDKSRLLRACTKIVKLGNVLKPYFQVVDIFESSHPDWAGIAWGAVRLVFQVISFF